MRLIDADALIEEIQNVYEEEKSEDPKWAIGLRYSKRIIRDMPTVDAEKLLKEQPQQKTGHWIYQDAYNTMWDHTCSECGKLICTERGTYAHFCWNCGAKMEIEL